MLAESFGVLPHQMADLTVTEYADMVRLLTDRADRMKRASRKTARG